MKAQCLGHHCLRKAVSIKTHNNKKDNGKPKKKKKALCFVSGFNMIGTGKEYFNNLVI